MEYGVKAALRKRRLSALTEACEATESEHNGNPIVKSFNLLEGDEEAQKAWRDTWKDAPGRTPIQWDEVPGECAPTVDQFHAALWDEDADLCGQILLKVQKNNIRIRAIERNPDVNHPLTSAVQPLLLDMSARFAQKLGRREIRITVTDQELISIYRDVYGFEVVDESKGRATLRREV
ncbi:hypothetical protein QIH77_22780 [Bradyrhizobium diazoefficiens]|uniref:hypothetical protein n=1 Tax=Bradyrhizobium diazoefficiens TaxID=1355477 RepID=UPI00272A8A85|nr:hypothetical protein [Bradyrhizobium diazoefficiens]WLA69747.1 hypothetical protein QIH77_22780 [Bradyrhizobium diazoefficiens]